MPVQSLCSALTNYIYRLYPLTNFIPVAQLHCTVWYGMTGSIADNIAYGLDREVSEGIEL